MNLIDQTIEIEDDILIDISKVKFFNLISKHKIDLDKVVNKKKSFNEDFHRFNLLLKKLNYEGISILDCAGFLLEDYFKEREVLCCFNEENTFLLKEELKIKYKEMFLKRSLKKALKLFS